MGLPAAHADLGGIEVRPAAEPSAPGECDHMWDMELAGYGGASLPLDAGKRSATAALGTQITDTAYRLLVCHRVAGRSPVVAGYGGRPVPLGRKIAGMAAREAADFLAAGDDDTDAGEPPSGAKEPPPARMRTILGANGADHLAILRDTFPAGSLRRRAAAGGRGGPGGHSAKGHLRQRDTLPGLRRPEAGRPGDTARRSDRGPDGVRAAHNDHRPAADGVYRPGVVGRLL